MKAKVKATGEIITVKLFKDDMDDDKCFNVNDKNEEFFEDEIEIIYE